MVRLTDLTIPNHESYTLQQKISGTRSVYGSDTYNPKALTGIPAPVLKKRTTALPSREFLGETIQQSAGDEVAIDKIKRSFFSDLLKKQIKAANEQENAFLSARQEGELNANKGHGGVTGMECLRQCQAVADRVPQSEAAPKVTKFTTQRAQSAPFKRDESLLKLNNTSSMWRTSHDLEFGIRHKLCPDPISNLESTRDVNLTAGTTKSVNRFRNVSYMGHIPSNRNNVAFLEHEPDAARLHMKDNLMITAHIDVPGYSGFKPKSVFNDTGERSKYDLKKTTAGLAGIQVERDSLIGPMNTRDHAVSHSMKTFFSRGHTGEDLVVAETYYTKYRPYEGLMKMGKD